MNTKTFILFCLLIISLIAPFFQITFIAGNLSYVDPLLVAILLVNIPRQHYRAFGGVIGLTVISVFSFASIIGNVENYGSNINQVMLSTRWLFYAGLVYLMVGYVNANIARVRLMLFAVATSTLLTTLWAWYVWFETPVYLFGEIPMLHLTAPNSTYIINRNYLGFFLSIGFGMWFVIAIHRNNSLAEQFCYKIIALVMAISAILSFSKGTWISSILPTVIFIVIRLRTSGVTVLSALTTRTMLFWFVFAITAGVVAANYESLSYVREAFVAAISDRIDGSGVSNMERVDFAQEAFQLMADNPVFGVGAGNYLEASINNGYSATSDPHNALLWLGAELGVLCLSVLIVLLVRCGTLLSDSFCLHNSKYDLEFYLAFVLFITLLFNMPIHGLPVVMKHLWVLYALVTSLAIIARQQKKLA